MAVELIDTPTGQVRVENGFGRVTKFEVADGKRNGQVTVAAEHLREPVTGWADTLDTDLVGAVRAALDGGLRVRYTVTTRRKGDADVATPIADLDPRSKVRDLTLLFVVDGAGQPVGGSPTPPPSQSASTGPVNVPGSAPTVPQDRSDPPPAPQPAPEPSGGIVGAHRRAAAERHSAPPDEPPASDGDAPPPRHEVRPGVRVAEGKPWERHNSDGTPNLGSYEFLAAAGFVELAAERIADYHDLAGRGVPELDPTAIRRLAVALLQAADQVQAAIRVDGHVDRMDASHTRARGAVRTALTFWPVPFGVDAADRATWHTNLVATATMLLDVALDLSGAQR